MNDDKNLLWLDARLIRRNNRPRQYGYQMTGLILFLFLLLVYGLFYQPIIRKVLLIYLPIVSTGLYLYIFGFFSFSFWSTFYPALDIRQIDIAQIVRYKYGIMIASILILTALSLVVIALLEVHSIYYVLIAALWNIGISSVIVLFAASHNIDRCVLEKSSVLNFEAWGKTQALVALAVFYLPPSLFRLLAVYFEQSRVVTGFIILPVLVLFFHKLILTSIASGLCRRRYRILKLFKNREN